MNIEKHILKWYDENKRDLPWRKSTDPYQVWLSEIILQQTRISQGTSYFLKILEACPDVHEMADCEEEVILNLWQGLGYYSRARNMHATAIYVSRTLNGVFPKTFSELLELKGVGAYTAAAIASICFDEVVPSIDGNVYRSIARLYSISDPIDKSSGKKMFQKILEKEISKSRPGDFNQALMEFGATVCTPKNPLCQSCIFNTKCSAHSNKNVFSFPVKQTKIEVKDVFYYYFVFTYENKIWIRKREEKGIWKMLHDFPLVTFDEEQEISDVLDSKAFGEMVPKAEIDEIIVSDSMKHKLSHRRIKASFIHVKLKSDIDMDYQRSFAIEDSTFAKYPVPVLIDNFWQSFSKPTQ